MPTRLTRYILAELIKIFVVTLITLTVLILVIGVARELLRRGLGPMAVIELLPYVLPISLQFALPATALFAVCCVYGRMAADGEVATVKSAGISPVRLMKPAFVFATLLSPAAVCLGDWAVSWGQPGVNRVVLHSLEEIVYRVLENEHRYGSDKGFSIHVHDVLGKRLIEPRVLIYSETSAEPLELSAREGRLEMDPERMMLVFSAVDSRFKMGSDVGGVMPGEDRWEIPLDKALQKGGIDSGKPSHLPLSRMRGEAIAQERKTETDRGLLAAQTGFSLLTGRWEDIAGPPVSVLEGAISGGFYRLARLHTEPWRRWAGGFSCLCFVLVGAPLAMLARTADYWTSFGMCFLPILLGYYPLFAFGLEQAKDGVLPPYSVWLGNAVLVLVGLVLIQRVRRY